MTVDPMPGDHVRILTRVGLVADPMTATRFEEETAAPGDEATYIGPHRSPALAGWHVLSVVVDGRTLYAPVDLAHFEITERVGTEGVRIMGRRDGRYGLDNAADTGLVRREYADAYRAAYAEGAANAVDVTVKEDDR